jgi:hypothetical protein
MPTNLLRGAAIVLSFLSASLAGVVSPTVNAMAAESAGAARAQSLDGPWRIAFDPKDTGKGAAWFKPGGFPMDASRAITVPGNVCEVGAHYAGIYLAESEANCSGPFWYFREFTPSTPRCRDLRQYLRFGGVAYTCDVWLNGTLVGSHKGGQAPFEFDVTDALIADRPNQLALRITGPFVWSVGGINQHVSLVAQPTVRIKDVFARPDVRAGQFELQIALENRGDKPATVALKAAYGEFKSGKSLGVVTGEATAAPGVTVRKLTISLAQPHLWNLDDPFLYTFRVTSDWAAGSPDAREDTYAFRAGLRDFRIIDGWFHLNGIRIFVRSLHGGPFDPIWCDATPRTLLRPETHAKEQFALLKQAGFNMFRSLLSAPLPEQLDLADELGFLIYSEHETSWLQKDNTKFGEVLNDLVRRDRNHPSLVIWGLLNETQAGRFYDAAKAWLPSLRAIDQSRLVLLSSGRWDNDTKTGSASNPGSTTWDVHLGGEDPAAPKGRVGDVHNYPDYPVPWTWIVDFGNAGRDCRPVFLSECGMGTATNAFRMERKMLAAKAPDHAAAWIWVRKAIVGLQQAWPKYHLETVYPSIEQMLIDSELNGARQRELLFSVIRSNPRVNGYSLTSIIDWSNAEGVLDAFFEFKPGHLPVLQAGWAKLRWCLFVNPMHVYADQRFRIRVALASEDALPAGTYPATLRIKGPRGVVWQKAVSVTVPAGPLPPLAYTVFDEDVAVPGLTEGTWKLSAALDTRANAASGELSFFVSEKSRQPQGLGPVTVLGVGQAVRDLLTAHGATLRDYAPAQDSDREVILVGERVPGDAAAVAATWKSLYARIAGGAHAIFLSPEAFSDGKDPKKWLTICGQPPCGDSDWINHDWLYHKDVIAKLHPLTAGLQTKIMTPDYYGEILAHTAYFREMTAPGDAAAVAIRCTDCPPFQVKTGVMLGTYSCQAGKVTLNSLQVVRMLGHPAADRLLLNMVACARTTAAPRAEQTLK